MSELHLELLLGKEVRDVDGEKVGRIEEVRAVQLGGECLITHFVIGRTGLLERLDIAELGGALLGRMGAKHSGGTLVAWDLMDLSNPEKPKLFCRAEELKESEPPAAPPPPQQQPPGA